MYKEEDNNTKDALAMELRKELRAKPLSKIKVGELASACGIRRQTFYYHFEDIYSLLSYMLRQDGEALIEKHKGLENWRAALLDMFEYIKTNEATFIHIYDSIGRESLEALFYNDIAVVAKKINESFEGILSSSLRNNEYIDFLTKYYCISIVGLLENWLVGKINMTPARIIDNFGRMVAYQIAGATTRGDDIDIIKTIAAISNTKL